MEFDKIIETMRRIIRSDGSSQEKMRRIWEYLEAIEKEAKSAKPSTTGVGRSENG